MKKIIATVLCAVMLVSALCVGSFAAKTPEVTFSMKGGEGQPGDTVEIEVYVDKNDGTWSSMFHICFNSRYFTLLNVENGEVFKDSEFVKSVLTNNGFYRYLAEGDAIDENNTNTGLIATFTFEISKAAPNGAHDITIEFPDDGKGWFIDANDAPNFDKEYDVSCTENAKIIVTGSDATESPDTNKDGTIKEPVETKKPVGKPVTEAVTNEEGETVYNEDGSVLTEEVTDADGNIVYYETDDDGEVVTDLGGALVTFVDTTAETTGAANNQGGNNAPGANNGGDGEAKEGLDGNDFILIGAIAAVVIGAVIVIIVLTKPKKNSENKGDAPADEEPKDENK